MKVLVTGGAGFIGSHVCERLLREGHDVAIIDDLNDYYSPILKQENLQQIRCAGPVKFHECDICDSDAVFHIADQHKPEAIIHLAARAGVRPSLAQPLVYERVNVYGTTVLLEAARRVGTAKFIFASSSSIYGISNAVPFCESDMCNLPVSPYAATKLAGEKMCYAWSHLYGIRAVCLRFFTVYGPRQRPDLAIRKFTEMIDKGVPIPVFGDGSSGRDYTYVTDTVSGIMGALVYDSEMYSTFNLGNSSPVDLMTVIRTIEQTLGKTALLHRLPDQPGDVPITYADISAAQMSLAYAPRTSFLKGVENFIRWYRDGKSSRASAIAITA